MYKFLALLLFLPCTSHAITPTEGSALTYRIVGFSEAGFGKCTLQVAAGNYADEAAFKQHIIISQACTGKAVAEVPAFGAEYTWRMAGSKSGALHHFSTQPFIFDTTNDVMRIISNSGKYNDHYFFVDATRTLYDMQGRPVWFLPAADFVPRIKPGLRDLKASPAGTITYLMGSTAMEIDYNGNILLSSRGPGAIAHDTSEHFHREFTRLANGHYMMLGNESVEWPLPYYHPANNERNDSIVKGKDDTFRHRMEFGTIIEYDKDGKVVWSWRSAPYFRTSDLFSSFAANGKFPVTSDVHENAFYFDEQKKTLYVGFRNISRILKIKYPEGKVVAVYGPLYKEGMGELRNDLFCGQHKIGITATGDLYLFNNNSSSFTNLPQLLVLREPKDGSHELQKLWEYDCTLDGMNDLETDTYKQITNQLQAESGGSALASAIYVSTGGTAQELPDGAYFLSMSGLFAKMCIVNKNKEVLWSAAPETRLHAHGPFTFVASYRASIISRKELENMIWAAK